MIEGARERFEPGAKQRLRQLGDVSLLQHGIISSCSSISLKGEMTALGRLQGCLLAQETKKV